MTRFLTLTAIWLLLFGAIAAPMAYSFSLIREDIRGLTHDVTDMQRAIEAAVEEAQ